MAEVTRKEFECDKCSRVGERYLIITPEGTKTLDRCEQHNKKIAALLEEQGEWQPNGGRRGRNRLKLMSPAEINAERT